jgi:hypothetical protein
MAQPGFSLEFRFLLRELNPGCVLFQSPGLQVVVGERFNLRVALRDRAGNQAAWESDYGTHEGTLLTNTWHHCVLTADGGPGILLFVIDGVVNDGGATRQFGWGRYPSGLGELLASGALCQYAPTLQAQPHLGQAGNLRLYLRPLRNSEAIGNYRHSLAQ